MPYIELGRRINIKSGGPVLTPGELNYAFTLVIARYAGARTFNYQMINDVLGALDGAKAEFYRRIAVPYEEKKMQENGDVY